LKGFEFGGGTNEGFECLLSINYGGVGFDLQTVAEEEIRSEATNFDRFGAGCLLFAVFIV
jgi:hypothetical protein